MSDGWDDVGLEDMPDSFASYDNAADGDYHFSVTKVEPNGGKNGSMVVDIEVLAGNVAGCEGKTHREYFNKPSTDQSPEKRQNTVKRAIVFAIAVGLTSEEEQLEAKKAGNRAMPDFKLAVGRQFCGRLSTGKATDEYPNPKPQLGYDMWPLDSEKAKGIPLNAGMLDNNGDTKEDRADPDADPFAGII